MKLKENYDVKTVFSKLGDGEKFKLSPDSDSTFEKDRYDTPFFIGIDETNKEKEIRINARIISGSMRNYESSRGLVFNQNSVVFVDGSSWLLPHDFFLKVKKYFGDYSSLKKILRKGLKNKPLNKSEIKSLVYEIIEADYSSVEIGTRVAISMFKKRILSKEIKKMAETQCRRKKIAKELQKLIG